MNQIAFLFPGQGSQKVGMGRDIAQEFEQAREIFAMADRISHLPITSLCFEGPIEDLTQTVNLQPAVTAVNLSILAAVRNAGIEPAVCAGHSLGEYSALCAAGIVSEEDCLNLVFKRGELMHREATRNAGAMAAIVGLTIEPVNAIVDQASSSGVVAVANHNSAQQIVITGSPEGVKAASELATAQGAKAIALKVSGAWHSPLIQGAVEAFSGFLETIDFYPPQCDVIHNVSAATEPDPRAIRRLMVQQLCNQVRWYDSMQAIIDRRVDTFVEIGPGRVLTGLLKKILGKTQGTAWYNVYDMKSLEKFIDAER